MVQATEQIQSPSTQRCDRTSGDQPAPSEALRAVRQKMVRVGGETSNTEIDILNEFLPTSNQDLTAVFETLQEWEKILSASDIDFEELGL